VYLLLSRFSILLMGGMMNNDSVSVHILEVSNMKLEQRNWMLNKELTEAHTEIMKLNVKLQYLKECAEEEMGRDSENWLANEIRLTLKAKV